MDRIGWRQFEERVGNYFGERLDCEFKERRQKVGPEQEHKFDLVSADGEIVIECKSYTWTNGQNIPSAKVSTANEALFFLSRVNAERKMLVMQDDFNHKGQSLVNKYVEWYGGLMDDTEVWRYLPKSEESDEVERVREPGEVYYEKPDTEFRPSNSESTDAVEIDTTEEDVVTEPSTAENETVEQTFSGKYAPLYRTLSDTSSNVVQFRFDEISRLLGDSLPDSAYKYRAWWNPSGHSHAEGWEAAGWTVSELDLSEETVVFRKK